MKIMKEFTMVMFAKGAVVFFGLCCGLAIALDLTKGPTFVVTAYCPCVLCCGDDSPGITASGHVIQPGDKFCAAPQEIPFGTMLVIPGYGTVPVLDRGVAITGDCLDVFFDDHQEAVEWGIKYLRIRDQP